jgi:hypothetical protein
MQGVTGLRTVNASFLWPSLSDFSTIFIQLSSSRRRHESNVLTHEAWTCRKDRIAKSHHWLEMGTCSLML